MKKLLISCLITFSLYGCKKSDVSVEYYKQHLDEAQIQFNKCGVSQDEHTINCQNAQRALLFANEKEAQKRDSDAL